MDFTLILPPEIVQEIFGRVASERELGRLSLVSTRFMHFADSDPAWKLLFFRCLDYNFHGHSLQPPKYHSWKFYYKQRLEVELNWQKLSMKKDILSAHKGAIRAILIHENTLISRANDNQIKGFDITTFKQTVSIRKLIKEPNNIMNIDYDFIVGVQDNQIRLFSTATRQLISKITLQKNPVSPFTFKNRFVCGDADGHVHIYNALTGESIASTDLIYPQIRKLYGISRRKVFENIPFMSHDNDDDDEEEKDQENDDKNFNHYVILSSSLYASFQILQIQGNTTEMINRVEGHKHSISCFSHEEAEEELVTVRSKKIREFHKKKSNSKYFHLATGGADRVIKVWGFSQDMKFEECLATLEGHKRTILCIELKKDKLISGADDIRIWHWPSQQLFNVVGKDHLLLGVVSSLTFDPNTLVVGMSFGKVLIFDFLQKGQTPQDPPLALTNLSRVAENSGDTPVKGFVPNSKGLLLLSVFVGLIAMFCLNSSLNFL